MHLLQAIVLSLLQGFSELFPISSLGHSVILPALLHWNNIKETKPTWLAFLVALHLGTAAALIIFFRDEWVRVISALVRSVQRGQMSRDHDERLAWMVIVGTVPAGLVGFVLESPLRSLFGSPYVAATFLVVNGAIMYLGERLIQRQQQRQLVAGRWRRMTATPGPTTTFGGRGGTSTMTAVDIARAELRSTESLDDVGRYRDITQLSWRDAAIVGFAQIGALIPGISRSGITMVAGLVAGLEHEAAAKYSFLLATPIITAAGVLEVSKLFGPDGKGILGYAIMGMFLAGIAAYLSVRYLMRYFETGRLYPFAFYCAGAGVLSLALLSLNV